WRMRLLLVDVLAMLEDFDYAASLSDGFENVDAWAAPMTAVSVACTHARASRFDEASTLFERALEHPRGMPLASLAGGFRGSYVGGLAHTFKASIYARRGHLVEAELELGRVRPLVRNWEAETEVARAALAGARGEHEAASHHAAAAIEKRALDTWLGRVRLS